MSRKLKEKLFRIIVALILFIPLFIVDKCINLYAIIPIGEINWLYPFILYLTIYIIISYDILRKAFLNIIHGKIFDENFLMIIATFGAFALKEFPEACAVMIFYQIGEFFQDLAVGNSRREIASIMELRPDYANKINSDGSVSQFDPEEIEIGDTIRILAGERVPLDGIIINGSSSLDVKALTGESVPVDVSMGQEILSGSINLESTIDVKVNKKYAESTVNRILELVENASNVKSKQEKFITKFARWYTPTVVISAVFLALIGSLITWDYMTWISRALNFLVVSCPCAIVISIPLAFFISIGRSAKIGVLFKGSMYLENFNRVSTYVFDKTGTITKGNFVVSKIIPIDRQKEILEVASICESQSNHPIAIAIKENIDINNNDYLITTVKGKGVIAKNDKHTLLCGNANLLKDNQIIFKEVNEVGTLVYVAKDNEYLGCIIINDEIKEESYELISYFKDNNINSIMLTGDNQVVAETVSNKLGIDEFKASLLPEDKVDELDNIISNKKDNELIAYVGDGINDAPSLARSDIGIAMGGIGNDSATEASDIVIMNGKLNNIIKAKKIAKKTMNIVYQNIIFALTIKLSILILSSFGIANIWIAIFGDVGVALLCILNSLRSGR